jgi:protein-tyrosine phosphatase
MEFDQILDNLYVGSHPATAADIERLKDDFGITAVLNVQSDEDFRYWEIDWDQLQAYYERANIRAVRVPVFDFNHEDLRRRLPACVESLDELLTDDCSVLVHCNVGMNRSPSVVIAYLHWTLGWDLDEAVAHVLRCRACDPDVQAIREATEDRLSG